jgi:hypothetical protein
MTTLAHQPLWLRDPLTVVHPNFVALVADTLSSWPKNKHKVTTRLLVSIMTYGTVPYHNKHIQTTYNIHEQIKVEDALPDKRIAWGMRHWPKGFPTEAAFRVRQWDCQENKPGYITPVLHNLNYSCDQKQRLAFLLRIWRTRVNTQPGHPLSILRFFRLS